MEQITNELLKIMNGVTCHEDIFMRSEEIELQLIKYSHQMCREVSRSSQRRRQQVLQCLAAQCRRRFPASSTTITVRHIEAAHSLD
jgi:hypothetical protein